VKGEAVLGEKNSSWQEWLVYRNLLQDKRQKEKDKRHTAFVG